MFSVCLLISNCSNFLSLSQTLTVHTITDPPTVHILWQIPQYVIMSAGEVSFLLFCHSFDSVVKQTRALSFVDYVLCDRIGVLIYSGTSIYEKCFASVLVWICFYCFLINYPEDMKIHRIFVILFRIPEFCRLLTVTFGNIFVVIIAKVQPFDSQSGEFFLYSGLMAVNVMLFIHLAMKYKYRVVIEDVENDEAAARNANVINMNKMPTLNDTFTVDSKITPTNPRSSLSNASVNNGSEKLDSSPKCLKRNSCGKNGVDNYGYIDI